VHPAKTADPTNLRMTRTPGKRSTAASAARRRGLKFKRSATQRDRFSSMFRVETTRSTRASQERRKNLSQDCPTPGRLAMYQDAVEVHVLNAV
jgi:hypothetical protein